MSSVISALKIRFSSDNSNLKKGMKDNQAAVGDFTKTAMGDFSKLSQAVGVDLGNISGNFGTLTKGLQALNLGFKSATVGSGGLSGALKILKLAIMGTGIGALLVAFGSLVAYFKTSEEGQSALNKVMKVFGVIIDNVMDVISVLGEAIFKAVTHPKESIQKLGQLIKQNLINRFNAFGKMGAAIVKIFSKDWKEGLKDFANASAQLAYGIEDPIDKAANAYKRLEKGVKNFASETKKEMKEASRLADLKLATDRLEREVLVERAKVEQHVADARLKARQEDKYSAEERKKFLVQANKLQDDLLAKDELIAKNRLELRRIENTFARSTKENLDEEAQLEANLYKIQASRLNQSRQIQRELNTLNKSIEAGNKSQISSNKEVYKSMLSAYDIQYAENWIAVHKTLPKKLAPVNSEIQQQTTQIKNVFIDMSETVNSAMESMAVGIGESLGQMVVGAGNIQNIGNVMLGTLGGIMIQLGQMAIKTGVGVLAIKKALQSLNPYVAIAAGVALVALGNAVTSSVSRLGGGESGGGALGNSFNEKIDTRLPSDAERKAEQTITFKGKFELQGKTLVAAIENENVRTSYAR